MPNSQQGRGHILLVEDEPTNRIILQAYLATMGYIISEAEDGLAAWELLKKHRNYSLVVTDRRMPRMDGVELSKKIKADPTLRHIPIIMQTSADSQHEVVEGIQAGVYYYLLKPYEEETLLTLVRAALRDRQQSDQFEQRSARQREALGTFTKGEFHIRTLEEADNIAFLLGSLFPRPELAVMGLNELLMNSIEHGNLGIGYDEKARLLLNGDLEAEIRSRLARPENAAKKTIVQFAQDGQQCEVVIVDSGEGFNWAPYMEIEPSRATQANGRGIAKANLLSFDKLAYMNNGNQVRVVSRFRPGDRRAA